MIGDTIDRETRDMAVRALERANQAHERLDRQSGWMQTVDTRLHELGEKFTNMATEVQSLKVKVAFGAAIGSLAGGVLVGIALKFIS
jgi:tetrahydromethanopterin S-methyltransferase subunit G